MTRPTLHPLPHARAVLREQTRAVATGLRVPALAVLAALLVATVLIAVERLKGGGSMDFVPERSMLPGMAGLLLPVGVWMGEQRFGAGFLRTLPVDHRWHALARVAAGWVCLMAAVAALVLWMLAVVVLTGGSPFAGETINLLATSASPAVAGLDLPPVPDAIDRGMLRTVHLAPAPVLWLAPFTGATVTYLLASALAVGVRHPARWLAGAVLALFLAAGLSDVVGQAADSQALVLAPSRVLRAFLAGPYGFDAMLTARTESLSTLATLSGGERVPLWLALPDLGQWATATLLWAAAGLLALWLAASRHRERRRSPRRPRPTTPPPT